MHKIMLVAALLAVGALTLPYAAAQDVQHPPEEEEGTDAQQVQEGSGEEGTQVTGMVTEADQQTREITINEQTYVMPKEGGGESLFPQVGAEITLFYREEGGQKVITRIGQKQE